MAMDVFTLKKSRHTLKIRAFFLFGDPVAKDFLTYHCPLTPYFQEIGYLNSYFFFTLISKCIGLDYKNFYYFFLITVKWDLSRKKGLWLELEESSDKLNYFTCISHVALLDIKCDEVPKMSGCQNVARSLKV